MAAAMGKTANSDRQADWIIIGGGIPALVAAFYLQQRGLRVIVIDNNMPSASRAGAGILSPLPPWHYPPEILALTTAGAAAYPQLLAALGDDCGLQQSGMFVLPPFDDSALRAWQAQGGSAQEKLISAVHPHLAAQKTTQASGLWLPEVQVLQPRRLLQALRRHITRQAQYARRYVASVSSLTVVDNKVQRVELSDGRHLSAVKVLLAAGAWSGGLCPPPAPAITPIRGQLLLYRNVGIRLPTVVLQEEQMFYLLQRQDGNLLVGSTSESCGFDDRPSAEATAVLHQRAQQLLPLLQGQTPRRAWTGLRPAAKKPIIAQHATVDNLYINSGHFRYGVTMAPAAAQHLLRLLDGEINNSNNDYAA